MTITDALKAEHTIFLGLFERIERALPNLRTPLEVCAMAVIVEGLLQDHARRESELAFLALDHVLAENGHLERMHEDHQEIDARLTQVRTAGTCPEAGRLLKAALAASREHFRLEEMLVFPLLERVLRQETLVELGRGWVERRHELAAAV